jgi:hypothetical protein
MRRVSITVCLILAAAAGLQAGECDNWQQSHLEWIFCDDFEDTGALVRSGRYFEYGNNGGDFAPVNGVGLAGSRGMRVIWQQGEVDAGSLKLAFGRNPNTYMNKQNIRATEDFREIYYRMYVKMQDGWQGVDPAKLSRATVFASAADWRQAMIAHLWSDNAARLLIDPASCVDGSGNVVCTTYNDFAHLHWLGNRSGVTPLFDTAHDNTWFCVEAHVRLNDPGQSNGVQEFWIDGGLEARRENLNFVGTYDAYAINAVFFENYWNSGSVKLQERYFDNIVVSTQPVGCVGAGPVRSGSGRRTGDRDVTVRVTRPGLGQGRLVQVVIAGETGPFGAVLYGLAGRAVSEFRRDGDGPGELSLAVPAPGAYRLVVRSCSHTVISRAVVVP